MEVQKRERKETASRLKEVETGHGDKAEELALACGRGATTRWDRSKFQEIIRRRGEGEGGGGGGVEKPEGVAVL